MIPNHKKNIMIHCLATKKSWGEDKTAREAVQEVRDWHVHHNGWSDIAYAGIIDYDGNWCNGRDLDGDGDVWEETGAGAKGWNKDTIHLALVGGFGSDANDSPYDHFTSQQLAMLRVKIEEVQDKAGRKLRVMGHNEVSAKACPGFNVPQWYKDTKPKTLAGSRTMQGGAVASIGTVASAITAISQLEGYAQVAVIVTTGIVLVALAWVFRARISDWVRGRR